MNVKLSIFFSLLFLFHKASALNITRVLSAYPDFSHFNTLLTQTNLAGEINSRQTITILAVENSILSPLSGRPLNVLKNILSVHVILDYYDVQKVQKLPNGTAILTTLFQSTGLARGQQGFLNVTDLSTSSVAFGSAVPGSTLGSNLVKSIASQPYNFSILHVSNVIIPQGIDATATSPAPSRGPSASPRVSPTPSVSPNMAPNMSPPVAPPTTSEAPTPSDGTSTAQSPTPVAYAPTADPPTADAPAANTADAPAANAADAPAANAPAADAPPVEDSGSALQIGFNVVYTVMLTTLFLASRN
ncbi:hypothetical protein RD792_006797 [Penstemon davidsonii]|uniref:FAS1 domain-containing protein n=1 Tax=Penstemon davidsonii TaxID=160366 RepID=A0ABR0DWR1_9LAMI|nr:hypothetical protein RD792_006797 [Penstemon davidsonii]